MAILARTFRGEVVKGKGKGATLGYPTANIDYELGDNGIETGVFWCTVRGNGFLEPGIAIVGAREDAAGQPLLEVYFLYYHEELYGKFVEVDMLERHRGIETFSDDAALTAKIEQDVAAAKEFFKKNV
ncbi:MAG: riboflavin kinase [bacterium]|nr:riboflavin kinase [bacterium]